MNNNNSNRTMDDGAIHSHKDNASLRSSSNGSVGKTSLTHIDRLSTAGKVEPSVSATSSTSFDAETAVGRTATTGSASQSLQSIIHKSSNNSLAGSPTKHSKLDLKVALASDDSASVSTHSHMPAAFVGTVLEGHSFTPSASTTSISAATPMTSTNTSQQDASVHPTASVSSDHPADITPTATQEPSPPTAIPERIERAATTSSDAPSDKRSSMSVFTTWWSGSSSATVNATNPGPNSAHENSYTQPHGLTLRTSMLNMTSTASSPTSSTATPKTTASAPESVSTPYSKPDTSNSMDWEPSGPETVILQKTRGLVGRDSSSLPSSLPSSATFPSSMVKHTRPSPSVRERRGSTSSTQGLLTSILWSRLVTSQDTFVTTEPSPLAKLTPVDNTHSATASEESNAMDVDEGQAQNAGLQISPTHAKVADDPDKSADPTPKPTTTVTKLADSQTNTSKKRWSIFGYGAKDDTEAGPTKLRKSGDVLIEPESRPSSVNEATPAMPTSSSTSTLVAATPSTPSTTNTAANASVAARSSTAPTTSKKTQVSESGSGSGSQTPPQARVTDQIADPSEKTGPVAPALVGTSELNVVVPPGNAAIRSKGDTLTNPEATGTVSSSYSWLSIIPGLGNKTEEANKTREDMVASHQITDFQEGERKDIDGNTINFGEKQPGRTFAQLAEAKNDKESGLVPKEDRKDGSKDRQTFAQLKERENQDNGVAKEAGKAVASLSKVILRKKNVVLPNYYEQYPDVHHSLIALPPDLPHQGPRRTRSASIMKSAVNVLSNLLFSNPPSPQVPTSPQTEQLGTSGIRKVAIIGVHGWFPVKLIRTVIGEPTGTSKKFCDEMHLALKDYLKEHNVELEPEDCTLIPLEGEGKVLNRVEILYQNLVKNEKWKTALHEADLVLVATHSQGTPTSTILVARLIEEGMLRVAAEDPKMQRVGILAMAGISHGPFPFLKGNLIVRWFEAEAAQELFEFMDSETEIAKKYREALRIVLTSGVRFTCVASLEDQVVPLYSAVMTSIHHPSIVRAVYIDGATYQDDFFTNLISFSLRLRNSGVDDHGVLLHLSEVVAGSIYGEGHSTIYEEREVYLLAIRSLLEPPKSLTPEMARSDPILHPFRAKQTLNPFYLPWGMRGVMDEIKARGDEVLNEEMDRLKKLYDEWNPVSKGMKEIKFRLEPVRSRL